PSTLLGFSGGGGFPGCHAAGPSFASLAFDCGRRMIDRRTSIRPRSGLLEPAMDHTPSEELLESTHPFPGVYQIKAIGVADDDFEGRVVEAVVSELATPSELDH